MIRPDDVGGGVSSISVVIPTYNGARFVAAALESVFAQTLPPREIVVVDDCSTDETLHVIERSASGSPAPLRILQLPANSGGPAGPVNAGVEAAQGAMVALLEQDDVMHPRRLAATTAALKACPSAVVCLGGVCQFSGDALSAINWNAPDDLPQSLARSMPDPLGPWWVVDQASAFRALLEHQYFVTNSNLTFRRDAWRHVGGFDARWRINADVNFEFGLISQGCVAIATEAVCGYRVRSDSLSHRHRLEMLANGRLIRLQWLQRKPEWGAPCRQRLYWTLRDIAAEAWRAGQRALAMRVWMQLARSGMFLRHAGVWAGRRTWTE